ncbi:MULTISPECIES: AraC family transcriptional regulator [unclassified Aeromicrobium]|uniref:AraC family transcriptional regulator n=1 Tax=unclassified Aeromicrobium TaxID=2633570 RepID=UPI00396B2226
MVTSGRFVSVGPTGAVDGWQRRVSDLHGNHRIEVPDQQAPYHGRLDWHATELYRLVSWSGEPERLVRGATELRADPVQMYELVAPLEGEVVLESTARSRRLGPGDMALVSLDAPVATTHTGHCRAMGFLISEAEVRDHLQPAAALACIDRRSGLGYVAFETLRSLHLQAGTMTSPAFDTVARHLLDLLVLASRSHDAVTTDHLADIEAAIRQQVRQRAGDPTLDGESVAAALGWSLRQVQHVLRRAGTTPSELIRTERLLAARELLITSTARHLSVSQVAHRCGFTSHAVFSRAFRAEFGMSPTAMREESARVVKRSTPSAKA